MRKTILILSLGLLLLSCASPPMELTIMSFNVRFDNPNDGFNSWPYRKDVTMRMIQKQSPDIIGTQEALINQLHDFRINLPGYNYVGVGRDDGMKEGEHCVIFYKKDRFREVESGNFWLSETPDVPGKKGWDAGYNRVTTWIILEDIATRKQLFFINTHLDNVGPVARQEGVKLLLDKISELHKGLPVVLTGDFNSPPGSEVVSDITNPALSKPLVHTKEVAQEVSGTSWTYHGYGIPEEERPFIDYIFVSKPVSVLSHHVLPEKMNGQYISDHAAVVARIAIN